MTRVLTRRDLMRNAGLAAVGTALAPQLAFAEDAAKGPVISDMALGAEDAPITFVEYASLTCPHCATFHKNVLPKIKEEYIATGKMRFIFREVYFDQQGLSGAMLARCGADGSMIGNNRYFGIVDILMADQNAWTDSSATVTSANLRKIGAQAGLSGDQIDACFKDEDMMNAMITHYHENATADDIKATPTFVINGKKYNNMPWDQLKVVLEDLVQA